MRTGNIPFQFDMSELIRRGRAFVNNRVGDVTLNLPFVSFAVSPKDKERQIARAVNSGDDPNGLADDIKAAVVAIAEMQAATMQALGRKP